MAEFIFTLIFTLPDNQQEPDAWVEALGANGCDDALVGIGITGRVALNFTREADAASDAVLSAIDDVKQAIPGAILVEAAPDLVGLTDMAELLGFSRQYMRRIMVSRQAFPQPVHDGKTTLWHLETVLRWLRDNGIKKIPLPLLDVAAVTRQCNLQREMAALDSAFQLRLSKS